MKVVSKREAEKIMLNSLFKPVNGRTLFVSKFDSAKYKWYGSAKHFIGKDVPDISGVHAVYPERRQDQYGPYTSLMCIAERKA